MFTNLFLQCLLAFLTVQWQGEWQGDVNDGCTHSTARRWPSYSALKQWQGEDVNDGCTHSTARRWPHWVNVFQSKAQRTSRLGVSSGRFIMVAESGEPNGEYAVT